MYFNFILYLCIGFCLFVFFGSLCSCLCLYLWMSGRLEKIGIWFLFDLDRKGEAGWDGMVFSVRMEVG